MPRAGNCLGGVRSQQCIATKELLIIASGVRLPDPEIDLGSYWCTPVSLVGVPRPKRTNEPRPLLATAKPVADARSASAIFGNGWCCFQKSDHGSLDSNRSLKFHRFNIKGSSEALTSTSRAWWRRERADVPRLNKAAQLSGRKRYARIEKDSLSAVRNSSRSSDLVRISFRNSPANLANECQ
jgi:hypothetical protein